MSNPDVAGIEECKRLNWPVPECSSIQTIWWCVIEGKPYLVRCSAQEQLPARVYTRAPTIGEMLEYIRRREWQVGLDLFGPKPKNEWSNERQVWVWSVHVIHAKPDELQGKRTRDVVAFVEADKPADALANALAEAMEKEGKA